MDEAECIRYNSAIQQLRTREYPMLQGAAVVTWARICADSLQIQRTSTMQELRSTPNRSWSAFLPTWSRTYTATHTRPPTPPN